MKFIKRFIFAWIYCLRIGLESSRNLEVNNGGLTTFMNGKGYIHNTFRKASISWSTEILIIEFKTKEANVVLFYSGDMSEIVPDAVYKSAIIYIDYGGSLVYNFTRSDDKMKRIIDIKIKNKYGGIFNDNQWHKLRFIRTLNKGSNGFELKISIEEDDIFIYKKKFEAETLFIKTRFLSIGGVSNRNIPQRNFIGCLFKVIYKADNIQLDVLKLTQNKQHGFSEIGDPLSFTKPCHQNSEDFSPISFINSRSFVILKTKYESYKVYDLVLEFQPQISSFLLYFHRSLNNENFISVEVRELQVVIGISYFSKTTMWYPLKCAAYIGENHTLHLLLDYLSGIAKVTFNDLYVEYLNFSSPADFMNDVFVSFSSEIILGGDQFSKLSVKYFPSSVWMASLRKGFVGCLIRIILNDEAFDLQRSLSSVESKKTNYPITGCLKTAIRHSNCQFVLPQNLYCQNRGLCENQWPNVSCNCDYTNYEGIFCEKERQPIHFDGSEFIRVDMGTEFYTEVESILIRFKTAMPFVYVFSLNPSDSSEWNSFAMQLSIENGLPTLEFQPNEEKQVFKLSTNVSDDKWHSLIILRNYRTLSLILDGKVLQQAIHSNQTSLSWQQINVAAPLKFNELHHKRPFSPKIWLIKTNSDYIPTLKQNFAGQIIKFTINGMDIIKEYLFGTELTQHRWKIQAQAKLKTLNPTKKLYPITFHTHTSYLRFTKLHLYDSFSLFFYLKTNQKSGVLFIVSGTSNDFILLELMQGDIKLSFNMGSIIQTITSNCDGSCNLANNRWHSVEISRQDLSRNVLSLLINEKVIEEITILNSHKAKNFNLDKPAFLGGLPKHEYILWRENINSNFGFQGCIAGFSINRKKPINLLQHSMVKIPSEFRNQITHNCQSNMSICRDNHCKNGGQCLQQWEKASCDCSYTTFEGEFCTIVSATITFRRQVASYNYIRFKYQDRARNTSRDDIAFGLQTKKQDGTIIFIESKRKDKGDFMHLYLENGKLVFEYDMGAGIMKLTDPSVEVSDGLYRRVRIRRLGAAAWLQIDNSRSELEPKMVNHGRSFNEQTYVWIGAFPNRKEVNQFEGSLSGLIFNGLKAVIVMENKSEYPYLQIQSVGDIEINLTPKIKLTKNSGLEIVENGTRKTQLFLESTSLKNLCKDLKNGQCLTKKIVNEKPSILKMTTDSYLSQQSNIPILTTSDDGSTFSSSSSISRLSLIIIIICFVVVFVLISFCIICRCCRKRGDRGSYNLTKADKYDQRSQLFEARPDIQSSVSVQSTSPEKKMIELSPLTKNAKGLDNSLCRFNNGIILSSGGSTQTIATYISKNKEPNRKKKEIKEWYV